MSIFLQRLGLFRIYRLYNSIDTPAIKLHNPSVILSFVYSNKVPNCNLKNRMAQVGQKIPQIVFILGAPGSGKGTQCAILVKEFNFVHLSAGELLRGEIKKGSKDGAYIQKLMDEGKIVPVDITCRLLHNSIQEIASSRFLIDGFPRNQDNVDGWERIVGKTADMKFCLFLDCPKEVCLARIIGREDGSGRTDDTPEKFKLRIETFFAETVPIVEHFRSIDKLRSIASDRPIEQVYTDVKSAFEKDFVIEKKEP